jgi:hypothetical protein
MMSVTQYFHLLTENAKNMKSNIKLYVHQKGKMILIIIGNYIKVRC